MKKFWQSVAKRAVMLYSLSLIFFLGINYFWGIDTTWFLLLAWFVGAALWIGLYLLVTTGVWLFLLSRVAKRHGLKVEDIVFALYVLKWDFIRVAYDMNFVVDYEAAREELDLQKHWE